VTLHRPALGVVVLGMSRSGTSLASGSLAASGFYVGRAEDLTPADIDNPAGYWEHIKVWGLNERLLAASGASWFTPPSRTAQQSLQPWASQQVRAVCERLQAEAGDRPLVIKDPRIGVLLDLWGPVIARGLHSALAVRHPAEIALSLERREGIPAALALVSWELHTRRILAYLHGRRVAVVHYDDLLRVPSAAGDFVAAAAEGLAGPLKPCIDAGAAPATVRPSLRHHDAASLDAVEHLTGSQARLWSFLSGLPPGNQVLDVPPELRHAAGGAASVASCDTEWLRTIGAQLRFVDEHKRALDECREIRARAERTQALAEQAQTLAEQAQAIAADQRGRADQAEQAAAAAVEAASRAERSAARAEHKLEAFASSRSWRFTAPLRAAATAVRAVRSPQSAVLPE
jgi:hypothetical protein